MNLSPLLLLVLLPFISSGQCSNDITAPTAICHSSVTVYLNQTGQAILYPADVDNGSTDNCGIVGLTLNGVDSFVFSCSNLGITQVTLTVFDAAGNTSTCLSTIIVQDTIVPVANCRNLLTAYLDQTGQVPLYPSALDSGSVDNCGMVSLTLNGLATLSLSCSNLGFSQVALTAFDAAGNSSTCLSTVNLLDTIAPVANCVSSIIVDMNNMGFATISPAAIDMGSMDNCGISTYSLSQDTFSCWDIGMSNQVVLSVTDVNGNVAQCTTNVYLRDITPPVISCSSNVPVYINNTGNGTLTASSLVNVATDNCSLSSLVFSSGNPTINFSCSDLGVNTVTLMAIDASGNGDTCQTTVVVLDTLAPVMSCNQTMTVVFSHTGSATVHSVMLDSSSADNCGISTYLINGQLTDTFFCSELGLNTAVLTAIDGSGNMGQCSTQINIVDLSPINMLCRNLDVYLDATGNAIVQAMDFDAGSHKYCLAPLSFYFNTGNSSQSFTHTDIGHHRVVIVAMDSHGNIDSCNADIIVSDTFSTFPIGVGNSTANPFLIGNNIVNVYPNPSSGYLTIVSTDALIEGVTVTTTTGQVVFSKLGISAKEVALNLSDLPKAVYVVEIKTAEELIPKLVILK